MNYKIIDRILGLLFLIELCYLTYLVIYGISLWGISMVYVGAACLFFWLRVFIHFFIALAVIILLFLNKSLIKWVLLIYVLLVCVIEPYIWIIKPNAPEYIEEIKEIQEEIKKIEAKKINSSTTIQYTDEDGRPYAVVVKVRVYPYLPIKIFYIIAFLYVFLLRPKLILKTNNIADKIPSDNEMTLT